MKPLDLGFIGLGAIGAPIAERLLAGGHTLTAADVNKAAVSALVAKGARAAATPAAVAAASDIVFASLPSPEICREVALGMDGVAEGGRAGIYIETSTSGAACIEAIAAGLAGRGIRMLDAPVSGGAAGARSGHLTMMVSGPLAVFAEARPAFDAITDRLFHVGEKPGQAQIVKIANQLINVTNITVACEALAMTVKAGLDPAIVLEIINASSGRNAATEGLMRANVLARDFAGGARLQILHKDIALAVAEAERLAVASFVGRAVRGVWADAANDDCEQDFTNIYRYFEAWAGLENGRRGEGQG